MFPDEIDLCEEGSGLHDEVKDDKLLLLLSFEITTGDSEAAASTPATATVEFFMTISLKFNFAGVVVVVVVGFPNDGNKISLDNSITACCCDSVAVAETSESRDC